MDSPRVARQSFSRFSEHPDWGRAIVYFSALIVDDDDGFDYDSTSVRMDDILMVPSEQPPCSPPSIRATAEIARYFEHRVGCHSVINDWIRGKNQALKANPAASQDRF